MNLCNVNGKVPDSKRHQPAQSEKQHDQLQQNLSNARMCLFLLSFCDQSWGFGIKASYFFRVLLGRKVVTTQSARVTNGISPIID